MKNQKVKLRKRGAKGEDLEARLERRSFRLISSNSQEGKEVSAILSKRISTHHPFPSKPSRSHSAQQKPRSHNLWTSHRVSVSPPSLWRNLDISRRQQSGSDQIHRFLSLLWIISCDLWRMGGQGERQKEQRWRKIWVWKSFRRRWRECLHIMFGFLDLKVSNDIWSADESIRMLPSSSIWKADFSCCLSLIFLSISTSEEESFHLLGSHSNKVLSSQSFPAAFLNTVSLFSPFLKCPWIGLPSSSFGPGKALFGLSAFPEEGSWFAK